VTELYAFVSFAVAYPKNFLALVDSYSSLESGTKNFIAVAAALDDAGEKGMGVRLDSGDLAKLSIDAKRLFKEAGTTLGKDFSSFIVVASNDINEEVIDQLNRDKHQIDVFGVGTNLVTCQAQPALGMVYKLVESDGEPKIKLSEEAEKSTIPGRKVVYRCYEKDEVEPTCDLISLEGEEVVAGLEHSVFEKAKAEEHKIKPVRVELLTQVVFKNGD